MRGPLRFVLFDLDGTLVDSAGLHARAFEVALGAHRPAWLDGFRYDAVRGLTTADAFRALGETDTDALRTLVYAKRAAFAALAETVGMRAFPGAVRLLAGLAVRGVRSFVVTSAARGSALRSLRRTGLAVHVSGLVAAEDVTSGKPAPGPYLAAVKRFALRPHEGLAVEDSPAGLASARSAGLTAVRVHGRFDPAERGAWYPDLWSLGAALRTPGDGTGRTEVRKGERQSGAPARSLRPGGTGP